MSATGSIFFAASGRCAAGHQRRLQPCASRERPPFVSRGRIPSGQNMLSERLGGDFEQARLSRTYTSRGCGAAAKVAAIWQTRNGETHELESTGSPMPMRAAGHQSPRRAAMARVL